MGEQLQTQIEEAITVLTGLAQQFAGTDQYTSSCLASTRSNLQQHLAAERWNSWTERYKTAARRRNFIQRHKRHTAVDTTLRDVAV